MSACVEQKNQETSAALYTFPVHIYTDVCYYGKQNPLKPVKFLAQVEKVFSTCCLQCRIIHPCSAIKQAYQEWKVLQSLFQMPKYGNFTMKDVKTAKLAGSNIEIDTFYHQPFPKGLQNIFCPLQVPKDGNCAFGAISLCLTLDIAYAKCFRRACCLECMYEPEVNNFYSSMPLDRIKELVKVIRNDDVWINEYAIWVLSAVVSREINVFQYKIGNDEEYSATTYGRWRRTPERPPLCIFQQRLGEVTHYVALMKRDESLEYPKVTYVLPDFRKYEESVPASRKNWPKNIKPLPLRLQLIKPASNVNLAVSPQLQENEFSKPDLSTDLAFVPVLSAENAQQKGSGIQIHDILPIQPLMESLHITAGTIPPILDEGSLRKRHSPLKKFKGFPATHAAKSVDRKSSQNVNKTLNYLHANFNTITNFRVFCN